MNTSVLLTSVLPASLGLIMFGFGLSLTTEDFTRVLKFPRSVIIGLVCQFSLPFFAYFICKGFQLSTEASIGVMILSASPGGVSANLFSHLAHGDIALNLSLTAINSVLAAFILPFVTNISLSAFSTTGQSIGLQFQKTIEVFLIVLVPVTVGMIVKHYKPSVSDKMDKPVRIFSILVLVAIIVGAVVKEHALLVSSFAQIGWAMLTFNVGSMLVGYFVPLCLKLSPKAATAISMEVGIHNSTLSMYIALSLLGSFQIALPSAVYSIIMFFTAAIFSWILAKRNKASLG